MNKMEKKIPLIMAKIFLFEINFYMNKKYFDINYLSI